MNSVYGIGLKEDDVYILYKRNNTIVVYTIFEELLDKLYYLPIDSIIIENPLFNIYIIVDHDTICGTDGSLWKNVNGIFCRV